MVRNDAGPRRHPWESRDCVRTAESESGTTIRSATSDGENGDRRKRGHRGENGDIARCDSCR